jgi:hypothetical protein
MKKRFLFLFLALTLVGIPAAGAAPFLTCDPYPLPVANQPDQFEITVTPLAPFTTPATTKADGTVYLYYDLSTVAAMGAGAHNASAVAMKGGWRSGVSNVVPFTKPALASPNISIVSQ